MDNRIIPRVRRMSGRRSVWPTAIALFTLAALVGVACGDDNHHTAASGLPGQPAQSPSAPAASGASEAPAGSPAASADNPANAAAAPSAASGAQAPSAAAAGANTPSGANSATAAAASPNTPRAAASAGGASGSAKTAGAGAGPGQGVPGQPTPGQPAGGPAAAPAGAGGGATATGVTDNEIKMGMLSELSGPIAVYGQSFPKVAQAFFRERNEAGGINGRQVKLIVYDDAWDPVRGKAGAKRLVEQDKVFMMCCTQSLNTNGALTPYMDEVKIPYIGVDGLSEEQYNGTWTFPIGTSTAALGELMGTYAYKTMGARKAAIASLTVPGGPQYRDQFKKNFEAAGGQVVYEGDFNADSPDFSSFIVQARAKGADFITGFLTIVPTIRMEQAAQNQGWKPEHGFGWDTTAYVDKLIEFLGEYANGTVVQNHMLPYEVDSPGLREFKATVGKYYDLKELTYSPWLALTGVAARLTMESIDSCGKNLTRDCVREHVENIHDWDTHWGVKLTFHPGPGVAKRSNISSVFMKVIDKKFVPQTGILEAPSFKKAT
jgi:branched-chain amino acid transport system substrate-binding protein